MPRTKKEVNELTEEKSTSTKKATTKKSNASFKKTVVKKTIKKADKEGLVSEKKSVKKATKTANKKTTTKALDTKSNKTTKKATKSSVSKVNKPTKKATTSSVKKTTKRRASVSKKSEDKFINVLEYYDLPYRYNETVVKILAQTPKILFVYWDISDDDRKKYIDTYGEYFFNDTYPVLIVHNKTLNYSQELKINDFANSWYISIPDAKNEYTVELGRRFKEYVKRNPDMPHKEDLEKLLSVTYSNSLIMPNDHILLNELKSPVKYKNVKTNETTFKNIQNVKNIFDLYKGIYQVENVSQILDLDNPSSNPTSTFK